jgi:hypothetical protein
MANVQHDGSDFEFRMVVEDRYKRLGALRKRVKATAIAQLAYVFVRSTWKFLPTALAGWDYTVTDQAILAAGILLFLLYQYAFGFGKAQRERQWAIQAYTILSMFLAAEVSQ